jgi:hypothetical protein
MPSAPFALACSRGGGGPRKPPVRLVIRISDVQKVFVYAVGFLVPSLSLYPVVCRFIRPEVHTGVWYILIGKRPPVIHRQRLARLRVPHGGYVPLEVILNQL